MEVNEPFPEHSLDQRMVGTEASRQHVTYRSDPRRTHNLREEKSQRDRHDERQCGGQRRIQLPGLEGQKTLTHDEVEEDKILLCPCVVC
jgi:hypothetical protein